MGRLLQEVYGEADVAYVPYAVLAKAVYTELPLQSTRIRCRA